jgi:hypothetical protein
VNSQGARRADLSARISLRALQEKIPTDGCTLAGQARPGRLQGLWTQIPLEQG